MKDNDIVNPLNPIREKIGRIGENSDTRNTRNFIRSTMNETMESMFKMEGMRDEMKDYYTFLLSKIDPTKVSPAVLDSLYLTTFFLPMVRRTSLRAVEGKNKKLAGLAMDFEKGLTNILGVVLVQALGEDLHEEGNNVIRITDEDAMMFPTQLDAVTVGEMDGLIERDETGKILIRKAAQRMKVGVPNNLYSKKYEDREMMNFGVDLGVRAFFDLYPVADATVNPTSSL